MPKRCARQPDATTIINLADQLDGDNNAQAVR
jgi:hypothetical protein